ncbi:MAG: HNH endonuclease [Acidimicrobiales bacterium]
MAEQSRSARQGSGDIEATLRMTVRDALQGITSAVALDDGRRISVRIPPGVQDGQRLRLRGKGRLVEGVAGDVYLRLIVDGEGSRPAMECAICGKSGQPVTGMSNGSVFHEECLVSLENQTTRLATEALYRTNAIRQLNMRLAKANTVRGSLSRLFGAGDNVDDINQRLRQATAELAEAEAQHKRSQDLQTHIYDFLSRYPPDWEERTRALRSRCQRCGSSANLQIHHMTPLARGGSNQVENLECLCESCHSAEHGGRDMSPPVSSDNSDRAFAQRVALAREAIAAGADVEFLYAKPGDSYRKRTISPRRIKSFEHRQGTGSTLCLVGYCHLRNAERAFAFKRMKGLKLSR